MTQHSNSSTWRGGLIAAAVGTMVFCLGPDPTLAKERSRAESSRPSRDSGSATRSSGSKTSVSSSSRSRSSRASSSRGRASSTRPGRSGGSSPRATAPSSGRTRVAAPSGYHGRSGDRHRIEHRSDRYYRDRGRYHHRGSYYWGHRYYPHWGWVFGPDWLRYHYGSYWDSYYRPYWGGWWGSYWDWFFYTGYRPRYDRVARNGGYVSRSGALDLDVSPEEAEVWIDGEYYGIADNFDGFPEYLWLRSGQHTVSYYLPGYETIVRDYDLHPGQVIRVRDEMHRGESIHPEELLGIRDEPRRSNQPRPYSGASTYREDREIRNSERRADAERRRADSEAWREREPRGAGAFHPSDSADVGRLHLEVEPDDASVYLDGVFLGLARELSGLSAGLAVAPGEHVLQIVRPGYEDEREEFEVDPEEVVELSFDLDRD